MQSWAGRVGGKGCVGGVGGILVEAGPCPPADMQFGEIKVECLGHGRTSVSVFPESGPTICPRLPGVPHPRKPP